MSGCATALALGFFVLSYVPLRNAFTGYDDGPGPWLFGGALLAGAIGSLAIAWAVAFRGARRAWVVGVAALPCVVLGLLVASRFVTT